MSILRTTHSPTSSPSYPPSRPPLRILASGTLFLTHTLSVVSYPDAGGVARAQSVRRTRGGHSANVLAVLAQFRPARPHHPNGPSNGYAGFGSGAPGLRTVGDVQFCGPLAGSDEGAMVTRELEVQGIGLRFCAVRDGMGVPAAWVVAAGDGTKTAINHNPLPDMTHDEFVSRLGPVLAPENYDFPVQPFTPTSVAAPHSHKRTRSGSGNANAPGAPPLGYAPSHSQYSSTPNTGTPPFDWMHFEGRAPQTTCANMTGLHGLAYERGWRARCVFSLEVARAGVESLIPHADVVFFSKHYALSLSPSHTPRAFLIAMSAHAAPHALLVVDWGAQGAALLSVPTREYLQSSGWVEPVSSANGRARAGEDPGSVRTASAFWADGRPGSGVTVTTSEGSQRTGTTAPPPPAGDRARCAAPAGATPPHVDDSDSCTSPTEEGDGDSDSRRTSLETERGDAGAAFVDKTGPHDAFVAGMVFALSQRVLPGRPYTPSSGGGDEDAGPGVGSSGRWRLEECLRFATELAGRKGRRTDFWGLRLEMERAGWVVE